MKSGFVELSVNKNTAVIKFNRPEALNALNQAMLSELEDTLSLVEHKSDIKGVILTGAGKSFIAGADIADFVSMDCKAAVDFAMYGQEKICDKIENFPKPVIAAINGYCIGGGNEIAMACDIRIAGFNAVFAQPEASLGILPMWGGIKRLERLVGFAVAKELIITCRKITAEEALKIGLVNKIVKPDELLSSAYETMSMIFANSPLAVYLGKLALNCADAISIADANKIERDMAAVLFSSYDKKEGMDAFLSRRKANFN